MSKRKNISSRVQLQVLKRDRFTCVYCGATGAEAELQIDHRHPVSKGGSNHISNLQTTCRKCNCKKRNKIYYPLEANSQKTKHENFPFFLIKNDTKQITSFGYIYKIQEQTLKTIIFDKSGDHEDDLIGYDFDINDFEEKTNVETFSNVEKLAYHLCLYNLSCDWIFDRFALGRFETYYAACYTDVDDYSIGIKKTIEYLIPEINFDYNYEPIRDHLD